MNTERHDLAIRWEIIEVLELEPRFENAALGVGVNDGVVSLTGIVSCGAQCMEAERIARRVEGVRSVIMEVQIMPPQPYQVRDLHLSSRAREILNWFLPGEIADLEIDVSAGWLTLSGSVSHFHIKEDTEVLLRRLKGVTGLDNRLTVRDIAALRRAEETLKAALQRRAQVRRTALCVTAAPDGEMAVSGDLSPAEKRIAAMLAGSPARSRKSTTSDARASGTES